MQRHGYVVPLPDRRKAKCGGPIICPNCAEELAKLTADDTESLKAIVTLGSSPLARRLASLLLTREDDGPA